MPRPSLPSINERSTLHAKTCLDREWSRFFRLRSHQRRGFVSYQDLAVWEKSAPR